MKGIRAWGVSGTCACSMSAREKTMANEITESKLTEPLGPKKMPTRLEGTKWWRRFSNEAEMADLQQAVTPQSWAVVGSHSHGRSWDPTALCPQSWDPTVMGSRGIPQSWTHCHGIPES